MKMKRLSVLTVLLSLCAAKFAQGLKDVYKDYFLIGVAVNQRNVTNAEQQQLGLSFVLFPGLSSSSDEVFGERQCCDLSPPHHSVISFRRVGLLLWVPDVLCQHSEVVLWNLLDV